MTEAEREFEITDPLYTEYVEAEPKGGPIYDMEDGENPPDCFYNGEGMYLGDGIWVGMDFFD